MPTKPPSDSEAFALWGLTEDIWALMEDCWNIDPQKRPIITDIAERLPPSQFGTFDTLRGSINLLSRRRFRDAIMDDEAKEIPAQLIVELNKVSKKGHLFQLTLDFFVIRYVAVDRKIILGA